jgi:hypothetical protein
MDNTSVFSKAFNFVTSHYVMTASVIAFTFSTICFAWTTSYFAMWGIEFFDYATVSDMYAISLKLGVVSGLFIFFLATCVVIFIAFLFGFMVERHCKSLISNVFINFILMIGIAWSGYNLYQASYNPFDSVEFFKVDDILENSARVNVKLRWNTLESIDCVSIIGGTDNYLFVWDYKKSSPVVLSRTSVMMVSVVVPKAPDFEGEIILGVKPASSGQIPRDSVNYNRSLDNQQKYDEWVSNLKSVCY